MSKSSTFHINWYTRTFFCNIKFQIAILEFFTICNRTFQCRMCTYRKVHNFVIFIFDSPHYFDSIFSQNICNFQTEFKGIIFQSFIIPIKSKDKFIYFFTNAFIFRNSPKSMPRKIIFFTIETIFPIYQLAYNREQNG